MEQLSSREGGAQHVPGAPTVPDKSVAARRAITLMAALAVFGGARAAEAQQRGRAKAGKKAVAADSVFLSCPEQETTEVGGEEVAVGDECRDGRLEVRCRSPKVAAAWDIPSMPLPGGAGVSLPVRLLQGGSIFVRCEGDGINDGRILDIPPAAKAVTLPKADSTQVKEHPDVKAAEMKYLAAKDRLTTAETQMIRTGRDLLAARGKLDSAKKQFERRGAATMLILVQEAEAEYVRMLGVRQNAKAEYEAAQAEFDRSVEQYSATIEHVLSRLKLEALREPPARLPRAVAKAKVPPPAVQKERIPPSSPLRWTLSGGPSHSFWSQYDLVDSPGFSLEGDMGGVFRKRPNVGLQIAASYAAASRSLSRDDPRFSPRDPSKRLGGSMATLAARARRDFPLGRIGSVNAALRGSVGFGVGFVHTEKGVDAGVSRENGRDLADIPASNTFRPITVAGTQIVLTRDRISGAIGVSGMVGVFPMQGNAGASDNDSLMARSSLDLLFGYEF